MNIYYFPFSEYWWFYITFTLAVLVLLLLDLGVFHRKPRAVTFRELPPGRLFSRPWRCFNLGLWQYARATIDPATGNRLALEFLTGYIIEQALSVDNLFVFVDDLRLLWDPPRTAAPDSVLRILGAIIFRAPSSLSARCFSAINGC